MKWKLLLLLVTVPASPNDEQWALAEVRRWYGKQGATKTYKDLHEPTTGPNWWCDKDGKTCVIGIRGWDEGFIQLGMGPTWQKAFEDAFFRVFRPGYR